MHPSRIGPFRRHGEKRDGGHRKSINKGLGTGTQGSGMREEVLSIGCMSEGHKKSWAGGETSEGFKSQARHCILLHILGK